MTAHHRVLHTPDPRVLDRPDLHDIGVLAAIHDALKANA